jgi:hypothetical protein
MIDVEGLSLASPTRWKPLPALGLLLCLKPCQLTVNRIPCSQGLLGGLPWSQCLLGSDFVTNCSYIETTQLFSSSMI